MNTIAPQVGIDVSLNELVVSLEQRTPFRIANTLEGCKQLVAKLPQGAVTHLEASGGYERLVHRTLRAAGFKVVLHNPLKARRMAQALGTRAKTDPVDAVVLSRDGAKLPECSTKCEFRQHLADHSRAIEVLKDVVADMKKRMRMPDLDEKAKNLYERSIKALQKQIKEEELEYHQRVKDSPAANEHRFIESVPALGKATARVLYCELPEDFRQRTPEQLSSYSGLAPIDNSSGKRQGRSRLGRGNSRIKKALYMPAVCAVRTQTWARDLYARLKAKGRAHQACIVAVMRRLLLRAIAVLQRGSIWLIEPQKP